MRNEAHEGAEGRRVERGGASSPLGEGSGKGVIGGGAPSPPGEGSRDRGGGGYTLLRHFSDLSSKWQVLVHCRI